MGLLPSYQSIGVLAPILLIGLRLIQGFAVGGEIPGAAVFVIEHIPLKKREFAIGLVFMCITLGNTLGAVIGFLLTTLFNEEEMLAWGWRIPFIIKLLMTGSVLGIAVFGGLAPLIFTWLIHFFATPKAPALYVFGCVLLTFVAIVAYLYEGKTKVKLTKVTGLLRRFAPRNDE
ncbi:MAG: MFS transporter [Gammaproteobacteria bacterium]